MYMIKILRIEQWTKNLIIFFPAILSSNFQTFNSFTIYIIFLSFSLLASSTYILNDIKDVEQDRAHPEKKLRPLASGSLDIKVASIYAMILFFISLLIIYMVNYKLIPLFFLYFGITVLYSSKLKYVKYLDFFSITILFGVRIVIGATASSSELTTSFILFLLFLLTLISIGKKLAILNNQHISDHSKVKKHLMISYNSNELRKLCFLSSSLSILIFTFWNFQNIDFYSFQLFISFGSILLLYFFNKSYIKDSLYAKTENFVKWLIVSKNLFTVVFLCLLTLRII